MHLYNLTRPLTIPKINIPKTKPPHTRAIPSIPINITALQMRSPLHLPPLPLSLNNLPQFHIIFLTQFRFNLALGRSSFLKQLRAKSIREPKHACAHSGTIAAILALAPTRRDALDEIPQLSRGEQRSGFVITRRPPFRSETQARGHLGLLRLDGVDDALFFEALVAVLDGLAVHGLEVAQISLVI